MDTRLKYNENINEWEVEDPRTYWRWDKITKQWYFPTQPELDILDYVLGGEA